MYADILGIIRVYEPQERAKEEIVRHGTDSLHVRGPLGSIGEVGGYPKITFAFRFISSLLAWSHFGSLSSSCKEKMINMSASISENHSIDEGKTRLHCIEVVD